MLKDFKEFDKPVKRYMLMHWIGGFFLIYQSLLPVYMNRLNIKILSAGLMITGAAIADALLTRFVSQKLDKVSPNKAIALDWITEALPPFIYAFANSSLFIMAGTIFGKLSNVLNFSYQVYENEIFSKEKRDKIYIYHMITPEIMTCLLYPLVGHLVAG